MRKWCKNDLQGHTEALDMTQYLILTLITIYHLETEDSKPDITGLAARFQLWCKVIGAEKNSLLVQVDHSDATCG
jgi:hypothetical protein